MDAEKDGLIIVSSTDFRVQCNEGDVEWIPNFNGLEQPMYLGIDNSCIKRNS